LKTLNPILSTDNPDKPVLRAAADAYAILGRLESEQAAHASASETRSHWIAAKSWFQSSLEQLNRIHDPDAPSDEDVGPVNDVQIRKDLARCEAALRRSGY